MENLYKTIRTMEKLNQEQFAKELGTTALSVNRWENGKTEPNKMAQKQLFRFCMEHKIELGELIVKGKEYTETNKELILYHGSKKGIVGDIAPISRNECDFGAGFYMGTGTLQPLTLVCSEASPKFYTVSLDTTGLKILNLGIDLEWAMLIAFYRREMESVKGSEIYEKYAHLTDGYDLVVGYIANDRIPGGKKLIYTHIDMPLTAISDFQKLSETDNRYIELAKLISENNGLWSASAEKYLLENF